MRTLLRRTFPREPYTETRVSPLLIVDWLCVCVCDRLCSPLCESYISNTLLFSTFCAWCEICKCSPFAETLPDWQRGTFVASPPRVTHQSSANHLSRSVTPPAARRQARTGPSSSRVGESAGEACSLVREWEEQHPALHAAEIRPRPEPSVQAESKHRCLLFAMG